MTKQESDTIQLLRLPLTLLIVFIHFQILTHGERMAWVDHRILYTSLFQMTHLERLVAFQYVFSGILARVAVPAFFLLSGYLMCHDMQRFSLKKYMAKVKRRRITLLYPYIIWNVLTVVPVILITLSRGASVPSWLMPTYSFETINRIWGLSSSLCPIDYPLWFCRDLIMLTLFVPLLHLCLSNNRWYVLLLIAIGYMAFPDVYLGPIKTTGVFYYAVGIYLSVNKKSILVQHPKAKYIMSILCIVLFILNILGNHTVLQKHVLLPTFVFTSIFLLFTAVSQLTTSNISSLLKPHTKASFFIYACHVEFILPVFGLCREQLLVDTLWVRCLFYILVPLLTLAMGIGYYHIVNLCTPMFGRLLSGDR